MSQMIYDKVKRQIVTVYSVYVVITRIHLTRVIKHNTSCTILLPFIKRPKRHIFAVR